MNRTARNGLLVAVSLAACSGSVVATAQAPAPSGTPRNWSYEVDERGKRIARDNRVVKADGSWREEIRQGNCVTVKERSATGEYRETRQCSPTAPK